MKNHLKKISAIVFALILVLSMCSLAFAATEGGTDAAMAVVFKKSLKLKDTSSGIDLYAPEISYNYAVNTTALSAEELSYDASEGAVDAAGIVVKDGATAEGRPSVILGQNSISFSAADTIAAENNTEGSGLIVKEVSISTEPGTIAGIYRFRISETVEEGARETAGITHSEDYVSLRYLDVYIGYTNESMELSVKNVVLFRADGTAVTKTDGWTSANDLDTYETVDVMVTKTVTGQNTLLPVRIRTERSAERQQILLQGRQSRHRKRSRVRNSCKQWVWQRDSIKAQRDPDHLRSTKEYRSKVHTQRIRKERHS